MKASLNKRKCGKEIVKVFVPGSGMGIVLLLRRTLQLLDRRPMNGLMYKCATQEAMPFCAKAGNKNYINKPAMVAER